MEYFKGKVELDSEFSEERREKLENFLSYLVRENKDIISDTSELVIKVDRAEGLQCDGVFFDPEKMLKDEEFDCMIHAIVPETSTKETFRLENSFRILAHEYRHFIQEMDGVTAHEGDAEVWADEKVEEYLKSGGLNNGFR